MRIPAEGLTPSAPVRGLLDVAQVLDGDGDWLNGITLDPGPCGCATGYDPACDDTPANVSPDLYPDDGPSLDFDPFVVSQIDRCSVMGLGPFQAFSARLATTFEATQIPGIEHEFWTATLVPTNPHLASPDAEVVDADPLALTDAFAALEEAIAGSCRAGVIHITPATATWAAHLDLISLDGSRLRTILGTPVVAGAGYPGTGPDGDDPDPGAAWMYATGPIRVRRGTVEQYPDSMAGIDRSINRLVVRVERPVLVEWDRCLHAAQLALLGEQASDFGSGS